MLWLRRNASAVGHMKAPPIVRPNDRIAAEGESCRPRPQARAAYAPAGSKCNRCREYFRHLAALAEAA